MKSPSPRLLFLAAALLTVLFHGILIAGPRRPHAPGSRETSFFQRDFLLQPAEARAPLSCSGFLAAPLALADGLWVESRRRFQANFLLDELLLLVGAWLLARRHFRNGVAVFFAAVSAVGSCLYVDDAWRSVLPVRALPLVLALLHEAIETGSRSRLFLAVSLASAQALGNLPGTALVTPVVAALYFPALAWVTGYPLRERLRGLTGRRDLLLPLLGGLATALPVLVLGWVDEGGRPHEENGFLVTSTLGNPVLYLDLFLGFSVRLDVSIFPGTFAAAFLLVALMEMPRSARLRLGGATLATLVVLGGLLALFPAGRTGTAGPVVRLLAAFAAGWGLDRMLSVPADGASVAKAGKVLLGLAVLHGALTAGANQVAPTVEAFLHTFLVGGPPDFAPAETIETQYLPELLGANALAAAVAGAVLLLGWAVPRGRPLALALLLVLHPLDVQSWRFRLTWSRSDPIGPNYYTGEGAVPRETLAATPRKAPIRRIALAGAGLHASFWAAALAVLLAGLATARRKESSP